MQAEKKNLTIVCFAGADRKQEWETGFPGYEMVVTGPELGQKEYSDLLENISSDYVLWVDGQRLEIGAVKVVVSHVMKQEWGKSIGYIATDKRKLWFGAIQNFWITDSGIIDSPVFFGAKAAFLNVYGGQKLAGNTLRSIGYSLQKVKRIRFCNLEGIDLKKKNMPEKINKGILWGNYSFRIPFQYLISGDFFRYFFRASGKPQRDMVYRMGIILFACFTFLYMPYISRDYGVTGDEFPDHQHTAYVLDYFAKGDTTALFQPKTTLHLYGISMQVVAGAICRWFHIDNYYEARHVVCALNGALGVLFVGLAGLRWGGGLCGFLSILLMFFTPRFFGHSMNNLKDIPFATGYIISLYYTIRLFDFYPRFRIRELLGLVLGIALALGTRSGGLILYPMLFMYAGFFYVGRYGMKEFYKFGKYRQAVGRIVVVLVVVVVLSYILAIALWPFALQKPLSNVLLSLKQFTNYSIGLKTIFDGEQMMSNMLPWKYAPKYLMIAMPLVSLLGFFGYWIYLIVKRKEFTLISYFFLFATIFPVFWVIYKNSNLYGGIRHLLFVMPPLVVIAGRFWQLLLEGIRNKWGKIGVGAVFIAGLSLPAIHMVKNHPNDYVYFNEVVGGLKGAYGDYETDYYYNSLKDAYNWFHKNVDLPKDRKTTIVTNHINILKYYFRADTNVNVIYSRYYEKYAKDWDYAMFANVYINRYQLKNGLFPPQGTIYTPEVDGFPMTAVIKRQGKEELAGFKLEAERKYDQALEVFKAYVEKYPQNEEVLSRIAKLSFLTNNLEQAEAYAKKALALHPSLNEALYMLALTYIQENRLQEAMGAAQAIVNENAFSVDGLYLKALISSKMGNQQEAINQINRALSIRPNHVNSLALGGDILFRYGNYQSAVNIYNRLLQARGDVNDLVRLADCYCRMKAYGKAEQLLKKVEEVQPGFLPAAKVWLRIMIQQENWNGAAALLKQLEPINNDPEIFVLRALYLYGTGKQGEAIQSVNKAMQMDPENLEAAALSKGWQKRAG